MFSRIFTVVLALALVLTGFWGYREHQEKQALLIKAENQYQRAFHDLSDHMNQLQDELGKSLAVNTKKQLTPNLTEAWRIAAEARSDVGELPLSLMPFDSTMSFLNDIGNFSYRVAVFGEQKKGLTDQEWKTLQQLYNRSKGLEQQLTELQSTVISQNLRWMDAETALASTDKKIDNQIVDGFKAVEKSVKHSPQMSFGPTLAGLKNRNNVDENKLTGANVTPEQGAKIAAQWLNQPDARGIIVQRNGKGNLFPSYSVTAKMPNGNNVYMTMSVKGGHITWVENPRAVKAEKIDLDQGANNALAFLKKHGMTGDEVVNIDTYDNVGVYDIVPVQNGVRIYPEKVTVQVALDNGEVVGLNSRDYHFNHANRSSRTLGTPKLTEAAARQFVSPHVKIQETHRAVVMNELKREELVYEFIGTMDQDTYKIYINATSGDEAGVEKL